IVMLRSRAIRDLTITQLVPSLNLPTNKSADFCIKMQNAIKVQRKTGPFIIILRQSVHLLARLDERKGVRNDAVSQTLLADLHQEKCNKIRMTQRSQCQSRNPERRKHEKKA